MITKDEIANMTGEQVHDLALDLFPAMAKDGAIGEALLWGGATQLDAADSDEIGALFFNAINEAEEKIGRGRMLVALARTVAIESAHAGDAACFLSFMARSFDVVQRARAGLHEKRCSPDDGGES